MKKRSQEIIDSQVISISDGVQVGTIKGFLINPRQKAVDFLLLNEGGEELKGIPFRLADGVGEYAITIQDKGAVVNMSRIGVLQEVIDQGINITGTKIISNKGRYLGEAVEFVIDTFNGELNEIIYKGENGAENSIDSQAIITLGPEVLVADDNAISSPVAQSSVENEGAEGNFRQGDEGLSLTEDVEEQGQTVSAEVEAEESTVERPSEGDLDPTEIFVQRQRQNLIGKTLVKDFKTDDGEVLARENEVVTEELFNHVYQIGTQKLVELATSVRE